MPAVDDLKSLNRLDQVVLGAGVLAFILSLFHVFKVSAAGGNPLLSSGGGANAWHNWGVFGMLLILVATAVAAVRIFAPRSMPSMPVGANLLTFALSALGFVCLIIAWFHNTGAVSFEGVKVYSVHLGIFGYLLLLASLAQAVAAFLLFRSSGEAMPDFKAMQANKAAGPGTPPPPVYGNNPPAATYPPATATPAGDYTLDDSTPPPPSV